MEFFRSILDWLLYLSLAIAAVRTYLIVNKLWSRRRSKEVAESISLMAVLLTYATTIPFFVEQVVEAQVERAISDAMKLGSTTVLLFIGGGFFGRYDHRCVVCPAEAIRGSLPTRVFSSQAYAQLIRDWYRGLDMLCFVESNEVDPGQALVRGARPV